MIAPLTRAPTGLQALRVGPVSRLLRPRRIVLALVLLAIAVALLLASLSLGERDLSIPRVIGAFAADAPRPDRMVVLEWRAPRAIAALLFGACLGVSGAIFQSLTDNPLGSPDVIGLNTGSFTGVLGVMMLGGSGYLAFAGGAVVGGVLTAVLVYALAYRGGMHGFRLIVVGIAISAMLASLNTWFSVSASLETSMRAAVWGAGTLGNMAWPPVTVVAVCALVLTCVLVLLTRRMPPLEMGDDAAAMLGVRVERAKIALVVVGVAFTSVVTAVAGPIGFIALAAPQIARRIRGSGATFDPLGAGLVGMVLLAAADLIAQHALPADDLPVGAVTVCIGGAYLVWLLFQEAGKR